MSSDSEDEGSEPWFFSGESPIKNWADEYDEDDEELDASDSSWLNDSSASQTPSSDSESRTSRGGKGPLPPARGAKKKKKGQRGKAAEGAGKKAVAAQATSPQRGGGKANGGRKGANKNAKQGGREGDRAGTATPAPAAGATTPKRGAGKKQKASSKKSVAVNRHLDSSFDSSSFETQSEVAYTSDPYTLASFATSAPEEAKIGHTLFPTVSDDFKSQMLVELLQAAEDPAQSFIVFARSTPTVVTLAEALDKINLGTVALKEDDPLELLPIYMDEFRAGKYRVLLIPEDCEAHTILSGLEHVTHSINYDVPDVERYLARMHALRAEEDMELIPLDVFTFITPHDVENVLALEMLLGPLRRHIGNVSSSLQPRDETSQHFHPTYQQHGDHARSPLHAEQKAQRAHNRQRREKKHSSPIKQQQSKPAKTKHIKQPTKTPKEVNKGFLPNTTRFSSSGASESWRSSPRAPVGGSWRA